MSQSKVEAAQEQPVAQVAAVAVEEKTAAAETVAGPAAEAAAKPAAKAKAVKAAPAKKAKAPAPVLETAVEPAAKPATKAAKGGKPAKAEKAVKAEKAEKSAKAERPKKEKLVRDSFTMPDSEYALIAELKKRCLAQGVAVKKSELLRAAIIAFAARNDTALVAAMTRLEVLKTGRPAKS